MNPILRTAGSGFKRLGLRPLVVVQLMTVLALLSVSAQARTEYANAEPAVACESVLSQMDEISRSLERSKVRVQQLTDLMAGNMQNIARPGEVLAYRLDNPLDVEARLNELQNRQQEVAGPAEALEWSEDCSQYEAVWQRLLQEKQQTASALVELESQLLKKPADMRYFLQQQLQFLTALDDLHKQFLDGDTRPKASTAIVAARENQSSRMEKGIADERVRLANWWQLTLAGEAATLEEINTFWLTQFDHAVTSSDLQAFDDQLHAQGSQITLGISTWRNRVFMNAGWLVFVSALDEPGIFLRSVFHELKILPSLLWYRISQPFITDYQAAIAQDHLPGLLTSWILQLISLVVLLKLLIRAAAQATSWLAGVQQKMLGRLESFKGHSIISGLFWMLKPNASWLFIILVAQASQLVFAEHWHILILLPPLATIYAMFRALRIIIEWGFSRTYTRSGLFLSNHTSEQLVLDSRRMTWIVLCLILIWGVTYAAEGGYLLYIVSILALIVLFSVLWWLMLKHAAAVNKLTHQVLGLKLEVAPGERGWLFRLLAKLAWPLIFMLVQMLDVISSLNQKLMVFDVYRSFSVKLLRVRLDSRAEEKDDEEDDAEPDQNYSDWMLREAPENLLFDVGDATGVLTPLKQWYSEKTDENVMVIIGESGSGKSTLIRRLPAMWTESPVKVLDVQPKTIDQQILFEQIADTLGIERFNDIAGLVRQDGDIEPQILVIDSAHNLFLAEVGQLTAYKALLECMNSHLQNVFWVVVMHSPSWTYLNCVFSREQRISNVYKMPRWSPMDIRKLILSRHQGGKRRLRYNEMLLSAAASSESSSVRAADSRVFNILWEQCGGNPLAAIELWLNAVKVKGRIAEVGVPQRPPSNLLNGLKDDLFFVYTAIVVHSELSTAEIMRVTHFSEPVVRHALKQGINLGMIVRDESKRYRIDPYWYGTLSSYLHRKNMLWD